MINLQHIFHVGDERRVGIRRNDPLFLQMRLEIVFFSVRPIVLSLARSTMFSSTTVVLQQLQRPLACDPWAVENRPGRSVSLPRPRQRCAVWPRPANACGPGRPRSLLPPAAGGSGNTYRSLVSRASQCGCHSTLRLPRNVSLQQDASLQQPGRMFAHMCQRVEPLTLRHAQPDDVFLDRDFRHVPIPGNVEYRCREPT